jgi:hypothetical protein
VRVTLLLGCWARPYSAPPSVKGNMGFVVHDHGAVHVDVGDVHRVHVHDGSVIEEASATPLAPVKPVAAVAVAVVDAAVESNLRSPITAVPGIDAIIPAPISGRPQ